MDEEWPDLAIAVGWTWQQLGALIAQPLKRQAVIAAAAIVVALDFLYAHHVDPMRPTAAVIHNGYWWWADQSRYLVAALAWAHGNFEAVNHWYFPGYPMLAALFVHVTPAEPFMIPNLVCLSATLLLFSALTEAVAPHRAWSAALGAVIFTVLFVGDAMSRQIWVAPWTTTPATPLEIAGLVLAMRFQQRATPRLAFLAALCTTGLIMFRPIDAMVMLLVLPPAMAIELVRQRRTIGFPARIVAAAVAGAAVPVLVFAAIELKIYGLQRSEYMTESASIGFEWRLLPLRWVTLIIDPRPLFPSGRGLAEAFPWVAPGIAALILSCLGWLGGPVRRHLIVLGFFVVSMVAYLSYRDLHPQGLWRFSNYHYFKPVIPLLAIYATLLVRELVLSPRRVRIGTGALACIVVLFCWHAQWRALPPGTDPPRVTGPHQLTIPGGLDGPTQAVLVPATGDFHAIYSGQDQLRIGATVFTMNSDIKAFPEPGGFLFATLRTPPAGAESLTTDDGLALASQPPPRLVRMAVAFGIPCGVSSSCPRHLVPGPALAVGSPVRGAGFTRYLGGGWSFDEGRGRWTDGPRATLHLRPLPPLSKAGGSLHLTANGFDPPGRADTRLTVRAGDRRLGVIRLGGAPADYVVDVPGSALDSTGSLTLTFVVHNSRRPALTILGSTDRRKLGMFLRGIELDARAAGR